MTSETRLTAGLYRMDCPDTTTLGEYYLGLVDKTEKSVIKAHVAICPHCTAELANLATFMTNMAAEVDYSLTDRAKVFIGGLISGGSGLGAPAWQPAFAVRGEEQPPLMYEAGDAQIMLEIQTDDQRSALRSITGLIIDPTDEQLAAVVWPVGAEREDPVASADVDPAGNFHITRLEPGAYDLIIHSAEIEYHLPGVVIS